MGQFYHRLNWVLENGDTINKCSNDYLFEGYHIITDNEEGIISDSNLYRTGYFQNGTPIGEWIDHYKNGSFAKGRYKVARGSFYDSTGQRITLTRGEGPKIGIWTYYNKDSTIHKRILHEVIIKKNWSIMKESIEHEENQFTLIYCNTIRQRGGGNIFSVSCKVNFLNDGTLVSINHSNFFRNKGIDYHENGKIKRISKYSPIIRRSVKKEYDDKGNKLYKKSRIMWHVHRMPGFR